MSRSPSILVLLLGLVACEDEFADPPGDPCAGVTCAPGVTCGDEGTCGPCPAGLEGDGATCSDIDGCAAGPCFAGVACADVTAPGTGFTCGECPAGTEGDGIACADVDGCAAEPCFAGVACADVTAPGTGFTCGECPSGTGGDGITCAEIDGCAGAPCLEGTTCADLPAPATGFTCSVCTGEGCPLLRAQAGPDVEIVAGEVVELPGDAVGFNGAFTCRWTNDVDRELIETCRPSVSPSVTTTYTLTVTDASGLEASDAAVITVASLIADAGPSVNVTAGSSTTLRGTARGASCGDGSCLSCAWSLSDGTPIATSCEVDVTPEATELYVLTVTDTTTLQTAVDETTVFVVDRPAQLCGWNVVVMRSDEYPSAPDPLYTCDETGTARRQTVNGKPSIVLSDLVVRDVRIVGHIGVETSGDDDLIGFLWGWEDPRRAYLLTWKRLDQRWTPACGNALAGIAVKKLAGDPSSPDGIATEPAYGNRLATDHSYACADLWSTDRADAALLGDDTEYLLSPLDAGGLRAGWTAFITYRFEFFYTPTRTRILIYEDDALTGSTEDLVAQLDVADASYPEGGFAFFSNSQEQVAFGDFTLASLSGFAARAGEDTSIEPGGTATLRGDAELAVPPFECVWSAAGSAVPGGCEVAVTPAATTTYELTVIDGFGRSVSDEVTITVAP